MQASGVGANQITQVRGFADQRLRKLDNPLDASNRRVSLIVQYIIKNTDQDNAKPSAGSEPKKPRKKHRQPRRKTLAKKNNRLSPVNTCDPLCPLC